MSPKASTVGTESLPSVDNSLYPQLAGKTPLYDIMLSELPQENIFENEQSAKTDIIINFICAVYLICILHAAPIHTWSSYMADPSTMGY